MPKTKKQKQEILARIKDQLAKMKTAVFVNFSGIPVKELNEFRSKAKEQGIDYLVAKKTILSRALSESNLAGQEFQGEVGALFGFEDEVAPAKLVKEFSKNHEKMRVVGGVLEGAFIGEEKVMALAALPSRNELLAKAVGSIAAPLSGLVNVLQGNLRGLVYVLNAMREKKI
ncbi:MAG: 50S ribosomal protein L10 [Patescibacteria group bacterium]